MQSDEKFHRKYLNCHCFLISMIKNCFQPVGLSDDHPLSNWRYRIINQRSNPELEGKRKAIAPSAINGKKTSICTESIEKSFKGY